MYDFGREVASRSLRERGVRVCPIPFRELFRESVGGERLNWCPIELDGACERVWIESYPVCVLPLAAVVRSVSVVPARIV